MTLRDEFLKINTYKEYDGKREKFRPLDWKDPELRKHLNSLYPDLDKTGCENGIIAEVYKNPPGSGKSLWE